MAICSSRKQTGPECGGRTGESSPREFADRSRSSTESRVSWQMARHRILPVQGLPNPSDPWPREALRTLHKAPPSDAGSSAAFTLVEQRRRLQGGAGVAQGQESRPPTSVPPRTTALIITALRLHGMSFNKRLLLNTILKSSVRSVLIFTLLLITLGS